MPMLGTPPAVTTTWPVVAAGGIATVMLVALQLVGVASVPLNVTVLVPWMAPKLIPAIVTLAPGAPVGGAMALSTGALLAAARTVVGSPAKFVAEPPPDTLTPFTCGDAAFSPTFTVTVIGG
jgi:hypothetical protein